MRCLQNDKADKRTNSVTSHSVNRDYIQAGSGHYFEFEILKSGIQLFCYTNFDTCDRIEQKQK